MINSKRWHFALICRWKGYKMEIRECIANYKGMYFKLLFLIYLRKIDKLKMIARIKEQLSVFQ